MTDILSAKNDLLFSIGYSQGLAGKDKDDFNIVIDGQEIVVEAGRAIRTMDTVADGWTASIRWDPNDSDLSAILKPFGYPPAECYLGGLLVIKGDMPTTKNILSATKKIKNLNGFSSTYNIIDSNVKPPYEQKKITLEERAKTLIERSDPPFGFKVIFDSEVLSDDEPFDKVTSKHGDKIFAHLASLATQRGILITSTATGDLLFTKANTKGKPVGTISEDFPPGLNFEMEFDGRKRFHKYKVFAKSPGRNKRQKSKLKTASAIDLIVPEYRFMTFEADDTSMGNAQKAADWKRSKTIADVLTIPFPVSGWYAPNGELWKENTLVTVKSPSLHVPDGFNFLIRSVEFEFQQGGIRSILNLVPPQAFTGEPITEPWGIPEKGFLEGLLNG